MRNQLENQSALDRDQIATLPERPMDAVEGASVKGGIIIIGGISRFQPIAVIAQSYSSY